MKIVKLCYSTSAGVSENLKKRSLIYIYQSELSNYEYLSNET